MIHIKRFIDKVSHMESRSSKDLILPIAEARGLRDELAKLLADINTLTNEQLRIPPEMIQVEIIGSKF